MVDIDKLVAEVTQDAALVFDLVQKLRANAATAKEVLKTNPDANLETQLADAKAKLAVIREHADAADADFDEALASVRSG